MQTSLLTETRTIKNIITNEAPIQGERKGKDPFDFMPYSRIMCCGNTFLGAMHDRSDGLYRRMIPIECKPVHDGRVPDRGLTEYLKRNELPGILNWMLQGTQRVVANGFTIEMSQRSADILKDKQRTDNPVQEFA